MLNRVVKKHQQPAISPATFSSVKKKKKKKRKEKRKVLNLLKPRMKCLILWSNDKEKKTHIL